MVRAKAIMTENVIAIDENATTAVAAKLMVDKHVKNLLVIKNNMPAAVVTKNNIILGMLKKSSNKAKVKDIMGKEFLIISPNTNYNYLTKKLNEEKIKIFPVVENKKLVGIITESDIIHSIRNFIKFHQIMQEAILAAFGIVTAFFLFFFSPIGQSIFR